MQQPPFTRCLLTTAVVCLLSPLSFVSAQTAPDAGQILQDTLPDREYQPRSTTMDLEFQGAPLTDAEAGGAEVRIDRIEFTGNTVFDDARLLNHLKDSLGQEHDMAGLQAIGNRVSLFYRENGYPFASAMLPRQDVSQGTLIINIVEGNYGEVSASGDDAQLAAEITPFLSALQPGEVIQGDQLERTALLLGDLPGLTVSPVMRPGAEPGTGDLDVDVAAGKRVEGFVSADNHGSRSSGEWRAMLGLQANRLLRAGDQLSITALYSEEDLWLGRVAYSLPLGYQGWRGEVAHARTEYDLRSPFDGFTGTADNSSLTISYPLIRQQQTNLTLSLGGEYTELNDRFEGFSYQKRYGHSVPVALQFDRRDSWGQGGVTFGEVRLESGRISNNAIEDVDGSFNKGSLRLSRLQNLGHGFSLLARGDLQWSDTLLDSSQTKSLGGPRGVRAYPLGELNGSRAWLTQMEVRYQATSSIVPYVFYDHAARHGYETESSESIAGAGIGVRFTHAAWSFDAAMATPTTGDAASEDEQKDPRYWFSARYNF